MKPKTRTTQTLIAALLGGLALQPACAAEVTQPTPAASAETISFKTLDTNKDGSLSMKEFTAKGLDDLAFRAADVNSDGKVDPGEYEKYSQLKATDPPKSGSGATAPSKSGTTAPKPTQSPSGY